MKRYTMAELARTTLFMDTEFVRADDHEAAIREAVAKRDDEWATAIAKYAAYSQCKAIADEMSAREST